MSDANHLGFPTKQNFFRSAALMTAVPAIPVLIPAAALGLDGMGVGTNEKIGVA